MDTSVPTSETLAQQQAQQHPSSVSGGPYVSAFSEVYPPPSFTRIFHRQLRSRVTVVCAEVRQSFIMFLHLQKVFV